MQPKPRFLPLELWDHIVFYLRYDLDALLAYRESYNKHRGWYERVTKYVPPEYEQNTATFADREQVVRIGSMKSSWRGPRVAHIRDSNVHNERGPIPHLGTFAAMLGGRWTEACCLCINCAEWRVGDMPPDLFDNLSTFTGITQLYLHAVTFPSIATFGRLVCTLPNLKWLECDWVRFVTHHFNRAAFSRRAGSRGLEEVTLYDLDNTTGDDITGFFLSMDISFSTIILGRESHKILTNVDPPPLRPTHFTSGNLQRFIWTAGASLETLYLDLFPGKYPIDISNNTQLSDFSLLLNINNVDSDIGCIVQFASQLKSNAKCTFEVVFALNPPSLMSTDNENINTILTRLCHGFCSQLDQMFIPPGLDNLRQFSFVPLFQEEETGDHVWDLWDRLVRSQMPTLDKRNIIWPELRHKYLLKGCKR